ncbi:CGH_3_HP_G0030970.mRNA.1.CDS.1 [Saccharomyces cerevisiae]|nr:CGH_3_HP_G0030970.mRNA.1.CDS.1 [Saccharomyces cerevisiae]CAI6467027.1 CGH_3_HP_G0030970.mRNA.1.CDS.1 [Saccharomyces cerevisiae]
MFTQHMTTATDDSYTSYFTEMDFAQITTAMVQVPCSSSATSKNAGAAMDMGFFSAGVGAAIAGAAAMLL